jgi:MipA family protein
MRCKEMNLIQFLRTLLLMGFLGHLGAAELTLRLSDAPDTGSLVVMVFDSANAFGDFRAPVRVERFSLDGAEHCTVKDLPIGEYAAVAYFDENNNGRLDENFMGIPVEPIGFTSGYRPKGPPSYVKARFLLEDTGQTFDVDLRRPLGKRGQIAAGLGLIGRSSPYRDYDGSIYQFIPAITYIGDRVQVLGPNVQAGLLQHETLNLGLTLAYEIGVYEEADSPALKGLGDREDTLMAGLALSHEFPHGIEIDVRYDHDVLDRIGGGRASLGIKKSFQTGIFRFTPKAGLNWLNSDLGDHYYGVPFDRANAQRSAYAVEDSFSWELGLGSFIELSSNVRLIVSVASEFLGSEITDSPIVSKDYVVKGFSALSYAF